MINLDNNQRIYAYIKNNPGAHLRRISKELGIALGDTQYQLRDGRYTKYYLKGNIKDIVDLLKSYHPSVWSKLSFRLAELFVDIADKSKPERDDDNPVLNDDKNLVLNDDKNEHTSYEEGKGGENKNSIWNKIQL